MNITMNARNLKRLAVGFWDIQSKQDAPEFSMNSYSRNMDEDLREDFGILNDPAQAYLISQSHPECKTCMCFAGHGPLIEGLEPMLKNWGWDRYILRVFGIFQSSEAFESLFSCLWPDSKEHAIKRLSALLDGHALCPESWIKSGISFDEFNRANGFDEMDAAAIVEGWRKELAQ